jgi:hypothetical protein
MSGDRQRRACDAPVHFIITPFYVRRHFRSRAAGSHPSLAPLTWLDGRIDLFERYCLPSVAAQTAQDFRWFLYFDESTPDRYLRAVEDRLAGIANASIRLCGLWEASKLARDVSSSIDDDECRWVMTTRLDNDDGVHRDFVATLQAAAGERTEFLNFPCGVLYYAGKYFLYKHPSNAFISYVEPVGPALKTVWAVAHEEASRLAPIRQLGRTPSFLQVVHGANVSNKPRGVRIAAARATRGFESITELRGKRSESALGVMLENATWVLLWKMRDLLISLVKAVRR